MRLIAAFILILCLQTGFFVMFPESQPVPSSSDLAMVFPGGDARIATGIKLVQEGHAPNFAISGVGLSGITALSKKHGGTEGVRLLAGANSRSTIEDALVMRRIVKEHQFKSVLLVTSAYHMPRSYLIARLLLLGTGAELHYYAAPDPQHLDEESVGLVRCKILANEMVKLWGSGVELAWYLATGTLPRDIPTLKEISIFMKKRVFSPALSG